MEAAAVICAAGASSRMGGIKKEYQMLKSGVTVLGQAVLAFAAVSRVGVIVIAVREDSLEDARASLPPETLSARKPEILFVNGGESRRASVFNALSILPRYSPAVGKSFAYRKYYYSGKKIQRRYPSFAAYRHSKGM